MWRLVMDSAVRATQREVVRNLILSPCYLRMDLKKRVVLVKETLRCLA